jgi:hypothetical protein
VTPEYEGDIRAVEDTGRRWSDQVEGWPTLPELYRNIIALNTKIDALNAKLNNGLPSKVNALEAKVKEIETTQNMCVWGRAGAWRFITGVFAVAGGITVVMNLVGKFAGWW